MKELKTTVFILLAIAITVMLLGVNQTKREAEAIENYVEKEIIIEQEISTINTPPISTSREYVYIDDEGFFKKVDIGHTLVEFKMNNEREKPLLIIKGVEFNSKMHDYRYTIFGKSFDRFPDAIVELSEEDYDKYIDK
jgi:hypothetical protein